MERLTDTLSVKLSPRLETLNPFELVQDVIGSIEGPGDLSTREPFAELEREYRRRQRQKGR